MAGRQEDVVAIVLDPRRDDHVIADGFRNVAPEDGRVSALNFGIVDAGIERRQHHWIQKYQKVNSFKFKFQNLIDRRLLIRLIPSGDIHLGCRMNGGATTTLQSAM